MSILLQQEAVVSTEEIEQAHTRAEANERQLWFVRIGIWLKRWLR